MQHDLVRSPFDLDLRSKNEVDLSRLYIVIFVSTRQTRWELYYCFVYKNEKVIRGERFRSKTAFLTSVTSGGPLTVDLRSNLTATICFKFISISKAVCFRI